MIFICRFVNKILIFLIALFIRATNSFQMSSVFAHFHISLELKEFFILNLKAMAIFIFPVHNFMIKFHDKRKRFVDHQKDHGKYTQPPLTLPIPCFL